MAALLCAGCSAGNQGAPDTVASRAESQDASPSSPRASLEQFHSLARAGRYGEAASFLTLSDSARGSELARQLKAVLDRHVPFVPARVSGAAGGDSTDGLAPSLEQVGIITGPDGAEVPVRLVRAAPGDDVGWRFARATVNRVPELYHGLPQRWIMEHLPAVLLRSGPIGLLWWQWLALPLLLAAALPLGWFAHRLASTLTLRVVSRTPSRWDDAVVARLSGPTRAMLVLAVFAALLSLLGLYPLAGMAMSRGVRAGFFVLAFWAIWRLVDVVREVLSQSSWAGESTSSRGLLPLGARVAKAMVAAVAAVMVLSLLGFPVASLLAGLGLGGLVFALAAQKTVENLFGAFALGMDQPFREGDDVRVGEVLGTVEKVGLRSTRLRTIDRSVVTLPNGQLADARIESLSARDRLRLNAVIGLEYATSAAQLRQVLAGIEHVLRSHALIWPDLVIVRFREFGASALEVEVMAWFRTSDFDAFRLARQEVLLGFMEVVERAGARFAFPTQTVHVASLPERARPQVRE